MGGDMVDQDLTQELWEQLTDDQVVERFGLSMREVKVLRQRFGNFEKSEDNSSVPPNEGEDEDNGSGGVPAPAKPPS